MVIPPKLPVSLPKLVECDVLGNQYDQTTLFDLTAQEAVMLAAQSVPGTYQLRYFTSLESPNSNTNWIVNPTQFENTSNPQTIWIRIEDTAKPGSCSRVISFSDRSSGPNTVKTVSPIVVCDTMPSDGSTEVDLTVREYDLFGAQPPFGAVITYHRTLQDAENGWNKNRRS